MDGVNLQVEFGMSVPVCMSVSVSGDVAVAVSVSVSVSLSVSMFVHRNRHICVCLYVCVFVCVCVCACVCACVYHALYTITQLCLCTTFQVTAPSLESFIRERGYVYVNICIYTYIYICTYIRTHTYVYTYIRVHVYYISIQSTFAPISHICQTWLMINFSHTNQSCHTWQIRVGRSNTVSKKLHPIDSRDHGMLGLQ